MVKLTLGKGFREEAMMFQQITRLDVFYLIGAMMIVTVALVYWADAIRERGSKKK
ncbi:hypothetical protein HY469_02050 [Candidatus Roizmanbacteria bacterium]|nr:hypothetical protein [Candidatus Roizmanbacteria bacterium]